MELCFVPITPWFVLSGTKCSKKFSLDCCFLTLWFFWIFWLQKSFNYKCYNIILSPFESGYKKQGSFPTIIQTKKFKSFFFKPPEMVSFNESTLQWLPKACLFKYLTKSAFYSSKTYRTRIQNFLDCSEYSSWNVLQSTKGLNFQRGSQPHKILIFISQSFII